MQIALSNGGFTEIDDCDESLARAFRWRRTTDYRGPARAHYAAFQVKAGGKVKMLYLHRLIMGAEDGQKIDHRDGDGLNNRRDNLRFGTQGQNMANRDRRGAAKSGFRGVYPSGQKWMACISAGWHSVRRIGTFSAKEDAARAYDEAALEKWGEFARLNFPNVKRNISATCNTPTIVDISSIDNFSNTPPSIPTPSDPSPCAGQCGV